MRILDMKLKRLSNSRFSFKRRRGRSRISALLISLTGGILLPTLLATNSGSTDAHTISPTQNGGPFWPTKSLYMHTVRAAACYAAGQAQGIASTYDPNNYSPSIARPYDGVVVLDFGRPALNASIYQTVLFGSGEPTVLAQPHQIANCVQQYAWGFYNNTPALNRNPPLLRILIGTSNNLLDSTDPNVLYKTDAAGHGNMWAGLVNNVSNYVQSNALSAQITIGAADDIEGQWSHFGGTNGVFNWLNAYENRAQHTIYNYGAAVACYPAPGTIPTDPNCNMNDWYQSSYFWVSTGAPLTRAIPEIYYDTTTNVNAKQWQQISLYGLVHYGQKVTFWGEMTQFNDCGYCSNTPQQGWTQLQDMLLNNDPEGGHPAGCTAPPNCHRTNANVYHSTDIGHLNR